MKRVKVIGIIVLCCVVAIATYFYITLVYMRTPEYVHEHLTPPYEREAADFFYANQGELNQLTALKNTLELDEQYDYTFHILTFNTPNIPGEILNLLCTMEEKTDEDEQYTISVSRSQVRVSIAYATNFDVYLFFGNSNRLHGMNQESEKETVLEDGWTVQAAHLVR